RIFHEDDRVVVGEGDRAAAGFLRGAGDRLRRAAVGERIDLARLRYVPVLAELAGQVAAGGAERQHRRSRQEMVERLLLDRVDAEAGGPPIGGEHDLVVLPRAHEAQAALALAELAVARADV